MKVIGSYRGGREVVGVVKGNEEVCYLDEGVNGDGCDEFKIEVGKEDVIEFGKEVGFWREEEGKLVEIENDEEDMVEKFMGGVEKKFGKDWICKGVEDYEIVE
jgi:hypothetical protein